MREKMRALGLHRKSKDYLNTLNIDTHYFEKRILHLRRNLKTLNNLLIV